MAQARTANCCGKLLSLLDQAGWKADNGLRRNAKGETLSVEFLIESPVFERVIAPMLKNMKLLGIDASIRIIDDAQYQSRREAFDYDIISSRFVSGVTPGTDLRVFFGTASAKAPGSVQHVRRGEPRH